MPCKYELYSGNTKSSSNLVMLNNEHKIDEIEVKPYNYTKYSVP